MKANTSFDMATAPKRSSRIWEQERVTWGELCDWVARPANRKECGNYVLGTLAETPDPEHGGRLTRRRIKTAVVTRGAITLDADHATDDLPDKVEMLVPGAAIIHTTFSSTKDAPRYRVIVPLDRPILPDEYHAAASVLMEMLGYDQFDPGSVQPERYMFRPAAERPEDYDHRIVDGDPVSADELLEKFDPDLSHLPLPRPGRNKRDPYSLGGWIGAFNRAYTVEEAIEAFELPYESAGVGRWHLAGARAQAGLNTVTEGLVFSHHVTDPAWGKTCSAFDLVRLHKFGHLDGDAKEGTPVTKLPSTLEMLKFLSGEGEYTEDKRAKEELITEGDAPPDAHEDFQEWQSELADSEDFDWRVALDVNQMGKVKHTPGNWDIIRKHHEVFKSLFYNELTMALETTGLPWRTVDEGGATFNDTDRSRFLLMLERELRYLPPASYVEHHIKEAAMSRRVDPIKHWLDALVWDGKKRLERCLPGVKPTPYTRMVARKSLVAAVARVFEPGVKWDHTLILYGLEGLGKTFWVNKMARGHAATLGRVGDKDTLLAMHRSWIMVSDEGFSLKKADNDVLKEFLTRTEDVFRAPYDRDTVAHKRRCVVWGSTNDEVFLRRQEGNRRFLIVRCEQKVDFDQLTDDYVDQVWAEAVALYRGGEPLFLDEEETQVASAAREDFTEEDALSGVLEAYLDTLVPEDWDSKSMETRQEWLQSRADGFVAPGTTQIERVCSAQLWVEALGKRLGDHKRQDLLEITTALKRMPGWRAVKGRHRLPNYGPQQVFERISE